jgi:DNA-directed RNA polymerase specialized sigma24 family protein
LLDTSPSPLFVSSTPLSAESQPSRRKVSAPDGAAAERQLARWIAEGDEAALAELVDLLGPMLYAVALGISDDIRHAEGAVEETFADLWDKRAWLGQLPALSPWLLERCRTWAIALKAEAPLPNPRSMHDRSADVPLIRRLLRCPPAVRIVRVTQALDLLDGRPREALALASRGGLRVSEISERLGVEPREVLSSLRRGMQLFRHELDRRLRREAP